MQDYYTLYRKKRQKKSQDNNFSKGAVVKVTTSFYAQEGPDIYRPILEGMRGMIVDLPEKDFNTVFLADLNRSGNIPVSHLEVILSDDGESK